MPERSSQHEAWAAAVRRHLDEPGRSITWLGEEVARIEGRDAPYRQPSVSAWLSEVEPRPVTVFAIEQALLQRPGTLSKLLGYVPASARPVTSARDAIASDPGLSEASRRALLAAYEQLVDHGPGGA